MPRLVQPATESPADGITVRQAAAIIGCDTSTVRELARIGQIDGWKVGKHQKDGQGRRTPPTGVRFSRASCFEYRARNDLKETDDDATPAPARRHRMRASTAILSETLASLRAKGFRV